MEVKHIEQALPFSIEAEKSVIGALLIDSMKMGSVQSILQDDDFYKKSHQVIFDAMNKVFDKNGVIDPVTLINQLDSYDELENVGGQDYIIDLASYTPT